MNYALLIYESDEAFAIRKDPERGPAYVGAWYAYSRSLAEAGVMTGGSGLNFPETATTIRIDNGKHVIHDGPYADTKEQLGGFFTIAVDNLDAALDWAAKMPVAKGGIVEVRPTMNPPA